MVYPIFARRWLSFGAVAGVLSLASVAIADIVEVGYGSDELPQLSEAEQEKLDVLFSTQIPVILSAVSPDGNTLVVGITGRIDTEQWQVQFLDLRTGELTSSAALEAEVFAPETSLRWIGNDVVQFIQAGLFGPQEIITINRTTDIVSRTSVYPATEEEGEVLGAAPDFSKFVVRVYEEEEDVIYVVFLPSLDRMEVARLPEGFEIQPPAWSDDGQRMALVTSSVEERNLYERTPYSPNFGDPVVQDALGRLDPEDSIFRQRNEVQVFDFSQPEPLQFALKATDAEGVLFANADISPDGEQVLVKTYVASQLEDRQHPSFLFPAAAEYGLYDLQGNQLQTLGDTALAGPLESQGQFVDASRLLFASASGLNRHFFLYDIPTQTLQPLPLPPGSVDPFSWEVSPDGQTLIYGFSSVTQPPELFTIPLDGSAPPEQLTTLNSEVAEVNQVRSDVVRFETRNGPREGLLIQPAGAAFPPENVPIVFWQQGGPGFSMANEFAVEVEMPLNLLPNFGIAVLSVPLAGREGYGPELFQLQVEGDNFGRVDVLEGIDIAASLIGQGWSNARQLGITGCSYGGYYASQAISRFPEVFAAANPQCSLLDTFTEWQLGYSSLLSYLVGRTPMEDPERYRHISPLYNAHQVLAPTMLFHGSGDFLQIDVARNFHDAIEATGVPVTLYEFENTGHAIFDPSLQRTAAQLQIDFFRQYLQP